MELNQTYAEHVAHAEAAFKEAERRHQVALERLNALRRRVAELESERASIIASRQADDECPAAPDDKLGGRLALIVADMEGLRPLVVDAEREADSLKPDSQRATLTLAQKQWADHQAAVELAALRARAVEVEELLIRIVREAFAKGRARGLVHLSMSWQPTQGLRQLVQYGEIPREFT